MSHRIKLVKWRDLKILIDKIAFSFILIAGKRGFYEEKVFNGLIGAKFGRPSSYGMWRK